MQVKRWFNALSDRHQLAVFAVAYLVLIAGIEILRDDRRDGLAYCYYGAQTRAQLDRCIYEVSDEEAYSRDTNAGAFARGELDECLSDAGPFCDTALSAGG